MGHQGISGQGRRDGDPETLGRSPGPGDVEESEVGTKESLLERRSKPKPFGLRSLTFPRCSSPRRTLYGLRTRGP